ncbi:GNAT family N-acetyltransferase [Actinoplanes sp. NPDC023714]|uniref:GNAT family N-acetyltransferase n=1 Tax=Actinoplanes sp. NPDC023714 TaxID=3154322 RepID=UPI0033FC2978
MDQQAVLALYDRQMRLDARPDTPTTRIERVGDVVRHVGGDRDWNAVIWSDLDETTAGAAIAGEAAYFREHGWELEWKLYAHDRPADLGERLAAVGFRPDERETLMVAAAGGLRLGVEPPPGVRIMEVTDAAGVELMVAVSEEAFGHAIPWLRPRLLAQLANAPQNTQLLVAMAGDTPVSAARMDLNPGTAFAGLWGGGTHPDWRGKGIYRALVAHRARRAAQLGYAYLQVDASDQSRPILERLGFTALTTTTPYLLGRD